LAYGSAVNSFSVEQDRRKREARRMQSIEIQRFMG